MAGLYEQSKGVNQTANAGTSKETVSSTSSDVTTQVNPPVKESNLSIPYTHQRYVEVGKAEDVKIMSYYRKRNAKVLMDDAISKQNIGSSVSAKRAMMSTSGELEKYLPAILGIPATSEQFTSRAERWYDNISREVRSEGIKLNTTFIFNTKEDYLDFKAKEDAITERFEKDRANPYVGLRKADEIRNLAIHNLEAMLYLVGRPENVEDYLLWRHCLLYNHVAKEIDLIKSSEQVRFYINDPHREARKKEQLFRLKEKAGSLYFGMINDRDKLLSIATVHCLTNNIPLSDNPSVTELKMIVHALSEANPKKFISYVEDADLLTRSFIERLIKAGHLTRLANNQNIVDGNGNLIAANIKEAIMWFNNDINAAQVSELKKRLLA